MSSDRAEQNRGKDQTKIPADFPAAPLTLEGYSILHQMFRVRRRELRALDAAKREAALKEASKLFGEMSAREDGETALFSALGHKGDLMIVHFRRSFEELGHAELAVAALALSDYLEPTTSYLSVIEIGLYEATVAL
jgi:hydrogen peroxide-dependent heme synthase